jgi:predicted small lipoprotein YifL
MVSLHTFNRVAKRLVLAMLIVAVASCGTIYELYAPPGATIHPPRTDNYENPDKYKVPESERRVFVALKSFSPPSPREGVWRSRYSMVDVLASEEWIVTHQINGRLVIFSAKYQARQERFVSGGTTYLYCLLIDPDGRVNKGWFLLRDPKYVVLASERMTIMDPSIRDTEGWPAESAFSLRK